ncbi:lipid II:glycine glycyltransferase (peptidoglycan interpeptide bridge formation enzyme) [Sporosarcina luteola]|nr:lipid II:glycine glycyltransferase (peptidoglycan interpeptide bridge formation enzyme) [Sporosarcina luteola]
MIAIYRNVCLFRLCNRYFDDEEVLLDRKSVVTGFSHSGVPDEELHPVQTIHIQLTKNEEILFAEIDKENRRQIRKAEKRQLQFVVIEHPTDQELKKFKRFYNRHAQVKGTYRCGAYHIQTMRKLAEQQRLVVTYVTDSMGEMLYCYRLYVTDGKTAMTLYSASEVDLKDMPEMKRIVSEANRYLIWKNIVRFKEKGVEILDMGGLTDKPSIQRFKQGFGGNAAMVYSGYKTNSLFGRIILSVRKRLLNKGRKRE